jgi:ubiquinone/menaquinone biosynthesis C-methylase UbiE
MPTFRHLPSLEERLAECRRGEVGPVTGIFWDLNYEAIVRRAFDISSKDDFVLDVGCGTGSYLIALSKGGRRCYGIDPLRDVSLVEARKRVVKEEVDVFLCQGVGEFLPFESGVFDVVLSMSTLQHVGDQRMTLREIRRVLKDKGLLLVSVPTVRNIGTLFREAETPCYFTMGFDIRSFEKILVDCDFRVLDMKGCGFFPPFTYRLLYVFYRFFGENLTRKMVELFDVFARVWLSAASSLIALCEKG